MSATAAVAQSPPRTSPRPAITRKYCLKETGVCFNYPAGWQVLGEAYINGVILAPPQKLERALWDEITVALIVLPPGPDEPATSIDQVIETATASLRESGRNPETLERQRRTVGGLPAQMIRVRYHDQDTDRDWVEQLVFIEGPEQEIHSVALKSAPDHAKQMEPAMAGILQSWKLTQAEPPAPEGAAGTPGSGGSAPQVQPPH